MTKISELLQWGDPTTVSTSKGVRVLRVAAPDPDFWALYRECKKDLYHAGITVTKRGTHWQVNWWQEPGKALRINSEAIKASLATDTTFTVAVPDGLTPYPYQRAGIEYASHRDGVLFGDEMGLGKSCQAILSAIARDAKEILVICPASLKLNLAHEIVMWSTDSPTVTVYDGLKTIEKAAGDGRRWHVINFDIVHRKRNMEWIHSRRWDCVIIDEAHKLKNPEAKRTQAIFGGTMVEKKAGMKKLSWRQPAIAADLRLALTGTPLPNRPVEVFPILKWLAPDVWGNYNEFVQRYCNAKVGFGGGLDVSGASNLGELNMRMRESCMVRREKAEVLKDLPPKTYKIIEFPPVGEMKHHLDRETMTWSLAEESRGKLAEARRKANDNEDDESYKQQCECLQSNISAAFNDMARIRAEIAAAKLPMVVDHLEQSLETSKKIIVFCHHRVLVEGIMEAMAKWKPVKLVGGMNATDKQKSVEQFQNGDSRLFVGNIQAAGVGITLTASSHVVFAEQSWVPAEMSQACDRAHRIGQKDNVLVEILVAENSLDAKMMSQVAKKLRVIDQATGNLEAPTNATFKLETTFDTEKIKKDKNDWDRGKKISQSARRTIQRALIILSRFDGDNASTRNNAGFSKFDSKKGHKLSKTNVDQWSHSDAGRALRIVKKYSRQLPVDLNKAILEIYKS